MSIHYYSLRSKLKSMENDHVNPVYFIVDGEGWAIGYDSIRGDFQSILEGVSVDELNDWLIKRPPGANRLELATGKPASRS